MKIRFLFLMALVLFFHPLHHAQGQERSVPAMPLTLQTAVKTALENHPELKALAAEEEAAKTRISQARYWEDPMVGVRFYQVPFQGGFDQIEDIDYIARQRFPLSGKPKAEAKQAYHEYQHHQHETQSKALQIIRDLKITYYELYIVTRQIAVSREMESNLRHIVQSLQGGVAVNQSSMAEVSLGQAEVAKVLAQRPLLVQKKLGLEAKLRELMAEASRTELVLPAKLDPPDWEASLEELLAVASLRHPVLLGGEHMIEEKQWGVKAAKRDYLPDLNLQTEYVQRPGDRVDAFTGEMMLNVPLIAKKKKLQVKQAEAELAAARYAYQADKNRLVSQIEETYHRMKAAQKILALNRGTVLPQTRQAFQLSSTAYHVDKTAFISVLSAGRMLLDVQMDYWDVYATYVEALFALEAYVGISHEEFKKLKESGEIALQLPKQERRNDETRQ